MVFSVHNDTGGTAFPNRGSDVNMASPPTTGQTPPKTQQRSLSSCTETRGSLQQAPSELYPKNNPSRLGGPTRYSWVGTGTVVEPERVRRVIFFLIAIDVNEDKFERGKGFGRHRVMKAWITRKLFENIKSKRNTLTPLCIPFRLTIERTFQ